MYASVFGAKVHLAHTINGKDEYTQAVAKRPIKLNQIYTLGLKVRDQLINVSLDGEFLFAYTLPRRQPGAVQLLAYDAVADFHGIEIRRLPTQVILERTGSGGKAPVTVETINLAEARLRLAKAEYAFAKARVDADNAVFRKEGNGSAETAGEKQIEAGLAKARVDLLDSKKQPRLKRRFRDCLRIFRLRSYLTLNHYRSVRCP